MLSTTQVLIGYLAIQAENLVLSDTGNKYAGNGRNGRLTKTESLGTPRDLGLATWKETAPMWSTTGLHKTGFLCNNPIPRKFI